MSSYFGATSVGLKTREGVVLATDRRMSYGTFIMSKNARKIFTLNKRVGIAFAGLYGDISGLIRFLRADIGSYSLTYSVEPTVLMVAKRLSLIMYSYKAFPFYVETIVGGLDPNGESRIYVLDSLGSITEEPYAAVGSGATIALGYLESNYREDLPLERAEELAENAVKTAIIRDAGSGDGIDLLTITNDGIREKRIRLEVKVTESRGE